MLEFDKKLKDVRDITLSDIIIEDKKNVASSDDIQLLMYSDAQTKDEVFL